MASPRASPGQQPPGVNDDAVVVADQKRAAARVAAEIVSDGMRVGLGTGSTVAYLLEALAERKLRDVSCVATSPATERAARALGLTVQASDEVDELDVAIDGADQIDPRGWLVKGGGGAHTREKIVAAAARRFVVIASADKAVAELTPPVPLEVMRFGMHSTLRALAHAQLRSSASRSSAAEAASPTSHTAEQTPDGGLLADYLGPVGDPRKLAARLSATPGVVDHGLFAPEMVSVILIARDSGVERRTGDKQSG
jgi:ribose 5-phosphate isomerase A